MVEINIAFSINKLYRQHLAVVIKSILDNTKNSFLNIYILNDELDLEDFVLFKEIFQGYNNFKLQDIKIDKKNFVNYPIVAEHLRIETLYRLMLAELLPKEIDKIIYLDTDIVVLDDIKELWDVDISEYFVAATNNITSGMYKVLHLEKIEDYFNAGILVINLEKWREHKVIEQFLEYTKMYPGRIIYADQDVLNGCFYRKWTPIHPRWNVQANIYGCKDECIKQLGEKKYNEAVSNPGILHFSGISKPWDFFCDQLYFEKYFEILSSLKPYFQKEFEYKFGTDKNVYVWGTGVAGTNTLKYLKALNLNINGFIDSNEAKQGSIVEGQVVFSPQSIDYKNSVILVASMYHMEIIRSIEECYEYIEENVLVVKPKLNIFKQLTNKCN